MAKKRTSKKTNEAALKKRLSELEREVETLEKQKGTDKHSNSHVLKKLGSGLLIGLTSLLFVLSISAIWLKHNIMNTEVWVSKTTQIIENSDVRGAIANGITDAVFEKYNVQQFVADKLPEQAQPLAKPISDQLESFTNKQVNNALASEAFLSFWQKANTSAHQGIINSLTKANELSSEQAQEGVLYINSDEIILNLNPVLANLSTTLQEKGLKFVPSVTGTNSKLVITIAEVPNLPVVLAVFNAINMAGTWLPIITVIFGALALFLAQNRRKALMGIGITSAVLLVLNVQAVYFLKYPFITDLGQAFKHAGTPAATAIYSIITDDLVQYSRAGIVLMLLVAGFGYLSGPGKAAVWLRIHTRKLFGGTVDAPALVFIGKNATIIVGILVFLAAILIVFPPVAGVAWPIWVAVITGLLSFVLLSLKANAKAK